MTNSLVRLWGVTLMLVVAASAIEAQATLADRIVSSATVNVPEWRFDSPASQPRQSPLSERESRPGRTTIWLRTLVWTWRHNLSEELVFQPARITVTCMVHPTLKEAATEVRRVRESLPIGTRPLPGLSDDATYAGSQLGPNTVQLRRGRVVAQIGASYLELSQRMATIIVNEVDRVPELLLDAASPADLISC